MKILLLILTFSLSLWANIGNIMAIKGSAKVQRSSTQVVATNGMALQKADTIITAKKSRVQVMLGDETVVTIGANSSFGFEDFLFDGTKKSHVKMRAIRGFFRSVTGKIGKIAPERFKVKTVSATIGIRGTDFSVNISKVGEVFRCYKGKITVDVHGTQHIVDAGMVMQLLGQKVQIQKMQMQKRGQGIRAQTQRGAQQRRGLLPVVTDIAKDARIQKEPSFVNEPFDITPKTEDRKITY